jgi:hypothetical protein
MHAPRRSELSHELTPEERSRGGRMRAAKIYTAKAEAAAEGRPYKRLRRRRASSSGRDPYASPAWRERWSTMEQEGAETARADAGGALVATPTPRRPGGARTRSCCTTEHGSSSRCETHMRHLKKARARATECFSTLHHTRPESRFSRRLELLVPRASRRRATLSLARGRMHEGLPRARNTEHGARLALRTMGGFFAEDADGVPFRFDPENEVGLAYDTDPPRGTSPPQQGRMPAAGR